MINQGTHYGRAVQHKLGKAKTGTNQVAVEFEITRGEHQGQRVPWYGFFTNNTWERTCQALRYCGWVGTDIAQLGKLENEVELVVEHEEYEDKNGEVKTAARVAWVNQVGGGLRLSNPMSRDELRQFSSQLKAKLAQHPVPEVASPPSNGANTSDSFMSEEQPPPPVEDDIPF